MRWIPEEGTVIYLDFIAYMYIFRHNCVYLCYVTQTSSATHDWPFHGH